MVNDKDALLAMSLAMSRAAAFAAGLLVLLSASVALAQRGSQHLNSPGYQRALIESRKPKPELAPPTTTLKTKRPRRTRGE